MASKVYPGSCHCGQVQYRVRLRFPPAMQQGAESVRIYRCNCSVCQKMGYLHCRPIKPAQDFILTSPSTIAELGDYRVQSKKIGWYFCKACGVRVVGVGGEWEQVEVDVADWIVGHDDDWIVGHHDDDDDDQEEGEDEKPRKLKVWKTKPVLRCVATVVETDGSTGKQLSSSSSSSPYHYVSVNAVTLRAGGQIDLVKWHEQGWIFYVDNLARGGESKGAQMRLKTPFNGGMY